MTLRSYLQIFRERWKVLVSVFLLCVAIAVLITGLTPKTYQADVQVFVTSNGDNGSAVDQNNAQAAVLSNASTFAELIKSTDVVDRVKSDLHLTISDDALRAKLFANAPTQQALVIVHATDHNANQAAAIANSAARAFTTVIENYKKPTDSSRSTVRLFVTQFASTPSAAVSPNPILNIALGVVLGVLLGVALAVARDVLDNRVKQIESFAALAGAPAMGVVIEDATAERHPIASREGIRNPRAENVRQLRANLQFADLDHHPRVIAITSSVPTEGKTMVAMNLASTLAEAGFTVALVDADLRRPTIAKTLGLPNPVGLTSVLIQQVTLSEALQTAGKNLFVLASGPTPPNPSEVLASSYVREVVRSLLDMVDYVVLDTAPLLPVADGAEVAALAEGTLLVARHKLTTEAQVKRSVSTLARVNARLIGVVLNGVPAKRVGDYDYGYGYYRDAPRRADTSALKPKKQAPDEIDSAHDNDRIEERA